MIHVERISKRLGRRQVLREISFELRPGELLGLIGMSGSGKSTLARCLVALERVDDGRLSLGDLSLTADTDAEGDDATRWRRCIGYVPQQVLLWPGRDALGQILEGLMTVRGLSKAEATDLAFEWARRFGVQDEMKKLPRTLSGGQRQRIGLIRALVLKPSFVILDEITNGLDPVLVGQLSEQLLQIRTETRLGILFITHQIEFLRQHADRVAFIYEGRLLEMGSAVSTLESPLSSELRIFLSSVRRSW